MDKLSTGVKSLGKSITAKRVGVVSSVGLITYLGYQYFKDEDETGDVNQKKINSDIEKKEVRDIKYKGKEKKVLRKKSKLTKQDKDIIFQISRGKKYYTDRRTKTKTEITSFMRYKYKLWSVVVGENNRETFKFIG